MSTNGLRPIAAVLLGVAFGFMQVPADAHALQDPPPDTTRQQQEQQQEQDGQPESPIATSVMQGPHMALQNRQELELSQEEVQELERLRDDLGEERQEAAEEMRSIQQELSQAHNGSLEEERARDAFEEMAELHTELGMEMLRARMEVREVLGPERHQQLVELGRDRMEEMTERLCDPSMMDEEMRSMMESGIMGPMMMHCPGMESRQREGPPGG